MARWRGAQASLHRNHDERARHNFPGQHSAAPVHAGRGEDGVRRRPRGRRARPVRETGQGAAARSAASAGRAHRGRLPGRMHPLRAVRARLPVQDPRPREAGAAGRHRHAILRGAESPLRDVRGHPVREGVPDRRARPFAHRHHEGAHGSRGADRPRDLPQLARHALRRLPPRVPADRQGDHARAAAQPAHRQTHDVHPSRAFRRMHRLWQVREGLRARDVGDQGAAAGACEGRARRALPTRLEGEGPRGREPRRAGRQARVQPAGGLPVRVRRPRGGRGGPRPPPAAPRGAK